MSLRAVRGFGRFWAASTVADLGGYVTTVAVQSLVVETLDGSAFDVGLVSAARWAPYLLFGLVVGVLVDRSRHRPLMVATDLGRGVVLLAVPVLALTHRLGVGAVAALMAGFGLLSLVGDAAFQAFVPRLVPPALLTPSHARLDQSDALAQTSGPALAGFQVSLLGAPFAVLVDAVGHLVSGLLVLGIPVAEPPGRRLTPRGVAGEALDGLRWVHGHPRLRPFALGTHAWFLVNGLAGAVFVPFAVRTLHFSASGVGIALSCAGAGALVGSTVATRLGARFGAGRVVVAAWLSGGVAWALVAAGAAGPAGSVLVGAGQLVFGLGMGAENANSMGYRQAVTPRHLQGRMNATMRSLNRAALVVGAPLGGLLGDALGYRVVLVVAAVGFTVVGAALARSPYRTATLADALQP